MGQRGAQVKEFAVALTLLNKGFFYVKSKTMTFLVYPHPTC